MKIDSGEFIKKLADLDKKMQEVDKLSINVRSAINDILWGLATKENKLK